jgi:FMN reductase
MTSVVVISAGVGSPSSTRLLGDAISKSVSEQTEVSSISTFELREHAVSIANAMTSGFANSELSKIMKEVEASDILIVVTPVFKASMSGLFKSFFDIFDENSLEGKTIILGATGGSSRHSLVIDMAMRPLFTYFRSNMVPTSVYAAPEDWSGSALTNRINAASIEAVNSGKIDSRRADNAMKSADFADLLAGVNGNSV